MEAGVWDKKKAQETRDHPAVLAHENFDLDFSNGTSSQSTTVLSV